MLVNYLEDASACALGPEARLLLTYARELAAERLPETFLLTDLVQAARAAVQWGELELSLQLHADLAGSWVGDAVAWSLLLADALRLGAEASLGPHLHVTLQAGEDVVRMTMWPTLPPPQSLALVALSHLAARHGGRLFCSGSALNLALPGQRPEGSAPPVPEPARTSPDEPPAPRPEIVEAPLETPVVAAPPLSDLAGVRQQILQHFEADELEAARTLLTEIHPRLPDPETALSLAEDCIQWGELRLAEAFYDTAADGFIERGDLRTGVETLQRMQILRPDDLPLAQMVGTLFLKLGEYAPANTAFRSILRTRPSHRGALAGLSRIAELTGDEALAELVKRRLQRPISRPGESGVLH